MSYNNYPPSLISLKMINSMQTTRRGSIWDAAGFWDKLVF